MVRRSGRTVAAVVSDVGRTGHALTRHDLPGGVAISFLFGGDADRPRTCQWRVVAAEESVLRSVVSELLAELARSGVGFDEPNYGKGICYIGDTGPWGDSV